jgi:hypothetical protein
MMVAERGADIIKGKIAAHSSKVKVFIDPDWRINQR